MRAASGIPGGGPFFVPILGSDFLSDKATKGKAASRAVGACGKILEWSVYHVM